MTWKPNATVATIIERDGQFLMVEEIDNQELVINQPAGHIEDNESIIEAALRETLEETGYSVTIQHLIGIYTYLAPNGNTYYRFCFSGEILEQVENATIDADIENVVWLSADDIEAQNKRHRSPLVIQCLQDYLNNKRFPLDLIYEHPKS